MNSQDNLKYAELIRKVREVPLEKPEPRYEWEELVGKMCASDDEWLHDVGNRERQELEQNYSKGDENRDDGTV